MRVLAGLGVLRQHENDRFYMTPFGDTLPKDAPQSVRDYAIDSHEVVAQIAEIGPKARGIDAKSYLKDRYLKRLEENWFVKKLWAR